MPKIPVNIAHIPTEEVPMDETIPYKGFCKSLVLSDQPSAASGLFFLKAKWEVTEPDDYRGKTVVDNYIPIPTEPDPSMNALDRQKALESGIRYGRMLRSMGYTETPEGFDTEEAIGREATFMVKNERFNDRPMVRVNSYLMV